MKRWSRQHPVKAFFVLAIAMSFSLLFPVFLVIPQEQTIVQILGLFLARIGVYSPIIAAMLIVQPFRHSRREVPLFQRLSIFVPVWLIAGIVHAANLNLTAQPGTSFIVLFIVSLPVALLPAFVVSSARFGSKGVKELLATLLRPTGKPVYYLVALLAFPAIHVVGTMVTNLLNGNITLTPAGLEADVVFTVFITFFSVLLFSGGINEESGWRGLAQKRMQARYSPLVANLILYVMMVIWHIPNDIVQYRSGGYILVRILLYPFITILFGWIYNRTNGSILAPALFHASMNAMNPIMDIFPITAVGNILLVTSAVAVVLTDRMWRKLPGDHPAVYQESLPSDIPATAVVRPA